MSISLYANEVGIASHYCTKTDGIRTASGTPLNDSLMTAAHKSYAFGTIVKVTNLLNKKIVFVKITDRGPYIKHRIIDLSTAAAKMLGMYKSGTSRVKLEIIKTPIHATK